MEQENENALMFRTNRNEMFFVCVLIGKHSIEKRTRNEMIFLIFQFSADQILLNGKVRSAI